MARKLTKVRSYATAQSALTTNKRTTFLDLPAELRNQIYGELLPDDGVSWIDARRGLRMDGHKASTTFMATCQQIHDEAASLLYGDEEVSFHVNNRGHISFLNQSVDFSQASTANFAAINNIKFLDLSVQADSSRFVCDVQDALFTLFGHFTNNHKLHALNVHINVSTQEDDHAGYEIFTSNYAERMFQRNIMREFSRIRPGDISRAHIAAFLTDPIRTVRLAKEGRKKGKFTLGFVGKTGRPWRELQGDMRGLLQGDSIVPDYQVFRAYFDALRTLVTAIEALADKDFQRSIVRFCNGLACARIRGDIDELHSVDQKLTDIVDKLISEKLDFRSASCHEQAEVQEHKVREIVHLVDRLDAALPEGADTSFYGYNKADAGLQAWQSRDRDAEKAEKQKRKREREEKAEAKKKAKIE